MPIGVNLLPWREQKAQRRRKKHVRHLIMMISLGCLLAGLARLPVDSWRQSEEHNRQALDASLTTLQKKLNAMEAAEAQKDRLSHHLRLKNSLSHRRDAWLDQLATLLAAIPSGVVFSRIEAQAGRWQIHGHAQATGAVPALMQSLQRSSVFEHPRVERIDPADASNPSHRIRFILTINATTEENSS